MSEDIAERIREGLDVLGQTPGSILYRDADRWRALEPGNPGEVLAIDVDGMPGWFPPDQLPEWSP